jgi:hypothetical protein
LSTVANLMVKINADASGIQKGLSTTMQKLNTFNSQLNNFGNKMTTYVTLPILAVGGAMLKSAMDLEATEAKYSTVFGEFRGEADAFIAKFKELTPATLAEARSMASGIQDLLVPMGFLREEAVGMTGDFMHVAGALANFNSGTHTSADVVNALTSAIVGQYEPLRSLGVVVDKTTLLQRALKEGLIETKEEFTKQIEAQVLLMEVFDQSGDALAAYTEENLDTKTKLALLKAEFVDTGGQIMISFLPAINKALEYVADLAKKFSELTPEMQVNIVKWVGVIAILGPAVKMLSLMITLVTTLTARKIALAAASNSVTASAGLWNPWALAVVAAIGLVLLYINDAVAAFNRLRDAQDAAAGGSYDYGSAKPEASNLWKGFGGSGTGFTYKGMFADGGIVPGPIGKAGLAIVHGGETVLPTHKTGFGGESRTVNFDLNGLFAGANISIGSEEQAREVAREIFRMAKGRALSEGVAI